MTVDDPGPTPPLLSAAVRKLKTRRDELSAHSVQVDELVRELSDDVSELGVQEGWEPAIRAGMDDWASDRGNAFRALRRAHFDEVKAHTALLACVAGRTEHGLSGAIHPPPVPGLFSMLPLSQTDRLGHPIAVLTLRDVARDEAGSLAELKDWVWFALEMVRRVLADYWIAHRHGTGAEGAVLLVDARDCGYRNMEVELLPTLFSVGHNSFPGVFETVYIVNAGWSHRAMWNSVVKRLLPRSAIDKVVFLESKEQTAEVFNLDSLPSAYGGSGLEPDPEIMLRRYSIARPHSYSRQGSRAGSRAASRAASRNASPAGSRASSRDPPRRTEPSRNASTSSIADVYYTAPPSPVSRSRPPSRKNSSLGLSGLGAKLAMTKHDEDTSESKQKLLIDTSASTVQRIKSLSDFHLYLSPSRLAHRDLLSDSEDDEPSPHPPLPPPVDRPRRTLRPAMLELGAGSIAARRAVSRQGITASSTPGSARASTPAEYASQLQAHHARGLEQYYSPERQSSYIEAMSSPEHSSDVSPASPSAPLASDSLSGDNGEDEYGPAPSSPQILAPTPVRAIAAPPSTPPAAEAPDVQFSTSNPWFGYPVVRVPHQNGEGYAIRPRYGRNRKRDLVKTLLWLFVLRLQTWRSAIERALGLNRVISLFSARKPEERPTPTEGLRKVAETRAYAPKGGAVAKRTERDWIWMVIGFLLLRGTWTRLLAAPMESAGLGIVRDVLGLATS